MEAAFKKSPTETRRADAVNVKVVFPIKLQIEF
jgi:hypothetical protein